MTGLTEGIHAHPCCLVRRPDQKPSNSLARTAADLHSVIALSTVCCLRRLLDACTTLRHQERRRACHAHLRSPSDSCRQRQSASTLRRTVAQRATVPHACSTRSIVPSSKAILVRRISDACSHPVIPNSSRRRRILAAHRAPRTRVSLRARASRRHTFSSRRQRTHSISWTHASCRENISAVRRCQA